MNYSDLLRSVPLYNKQGVEYPDRMVQKVNVPELRVPPIPPVNEMFSVWMDELNGTIAMVESYGDKSAQWDTWYEQQYLKNKPPGMRTTLAPLKK